MVTQKSNDKKSANVLIDVDATKIFSECLFFFVFVFMATMAMMMRWRRREHMHCMIMNQIISFAFAKIVSNVVDNAILARLGIN